MAVTLYCFGNNNKKEKFVHFQCKYFFQIFLIYCSLNVKTWNLQMH